MIQLKKNAVHEKQLLLWDLAPSLGLSTIETINQELLKKNQSEFQLSFPVNNQNFSLNSIDFVKILILDDQGFQDAILFVTQSQEGVFHLIFFEKMKPARPNPRRLEIVLEYNGCNYQRVGSEQHWETDFGGEYDLPEWECILRSAANQNLEPRDLYLINTLYKILNQNISTSCKY